MGFGTSCPELVVSLTGALEGNADVAIAYAQLFDFSNYTYELATELVELRGPRAEQLIYKI